MRVIVKVLWLLVFGIGIGRCAPIGFGQVFPPEQIGIHTHAVTNLTTPYVTELMSHFLPAIDIPIGGQRYGARFYLVDGPGMATSYATPGGNVLVSRHDLEQYSGHRVNPADPNSVNRAMYEMLSDPVRRQTFLDVIGHEVGHLVNGHTDTSGGKPATKYASLMTEKVDAIYMGFLGDDLARRIDSAARRVVLEDRATGRGRLANTPDLESHIHEYMTDEHSLYLARKKDLRTTLETWRDISPAGARIQASHPTSTARALNLVAYIQARPALFTDALRPGQMVELTVLPDVPPVRIENRAGHIVVSGVERVKARLALPEQLILQRYLEGRHPSIHGRGGPSRAAEGPRGSRGGAKAATAELAVPKAATPSLGSRLAGNLKQEFAGGGLLTNVAVAGGAAVLTRLTRGQSARQSVHDSIVDLTTAEAGAALVGASVGAAAVGAVLPAAAATGFRGAFAHSAPGMLGAFVLAELAANAVQLNRQGKLSLGNLVRSVDWSSTAVQAIGAAAVSSAFLRGFGKLALGPVAMAPILGGFIGAYLGGKLVEHVRKTPAVAGPGRGDAPIQHSSGTFDHPVGEPFADINQTARQ